MKMNKLYLILLILGMTLTTIGKSSSKLFDVETTSASFAAAGCFENCDGGGGGLMAISGFVEEPQLLFYTMGAKNEVGFVLNNVYDYDAFEYVVAYEHETEYGILEEVVLGHINNPEAAGTILEEGIFLGTETAGGTRVYHEGIKTVDLKVDLVKSGVTEKTLDETLNF